MNGDAHLGEDDEADGRPDGAIGCPSLLRQAGRGSPRAWCRASCPYKAKVSF
jgi:hypothetical protein